VKNNWEIFMAKIKTIREQRGYSHINCGEPKELYRILYEGKHTCRVCSGTGVVIANRITKKSGECSFAFGCNCIFGKFHRWNIPSWSSGLKKHYIPKWDFNLSDMKAIPKKEAEGKVLDQTQRSEVGGSAASNSKIDTNHAY